MELSAFCASHIYSCTYQLCYWQLLAVLAALVQTICNNIPKNIEFKFWYYFFSRYNLVKATFEASLYLLNEVLIKLKYVEQVRLQLLKEVILLFLRSASNLKDFKSSEGNDDFNTNLSTCLSEAFEECHVSLKKCLNACIGTSFGYKWHFTKAGVQKEIEVKCMALDKTKWKAL